MKYFLAVISMTAVLAGGAVGTDPASARPASARPASAQPAGAGPATAADPSSAVAAADAFMARRAPSLRASGDDVFVRGDVRDGTSGLAYVPYARVHAGLPVIGGDVVVATNADHGVIDTEVAQDTPIDVETAPVVTAAKARAGARARVDDVASASTPRLVITAVDTPQLAWETVVTGRRDRQPTRLHVFTDARTGAHIGEYDDVAGGTGHGYYSGPGTSFPTTASSGRYTMVDPTHPGVSCSDQTGQTFSGPDDLWGNGSGTSLETACVDAMHGADEMWRMLGAWLGRDGIDGQGRGFHMRVGLGDVNAFWYGSHAGFGQSSDCARQVTSLDVVGHELGHAVFGTTGLGGSGALNEGTADILGTLTEFYANDPTDAPDYLIGERSDFHGSGALRNFYDPATMGGGINCWSSDIDDQEVHAAAGVLDHWFYLLAEGSAPAGGPASPICAGGPSSVTGMGQLPAAKIFYNALQMKSYAWRYPEARTTTLQAARNLYPSSCTEFTKVKNAWNAVGVLAQPGEPTCPGTGGAFGLTLLHPTQSVIAGKSVAFEIDTTLTSGTARQVTLSASGLPAGVAVDFEPARLLAGTQARAQVFVPASTAGGTFAFTVTGTSGTETHSARASVEVQPWRSDDFSMSVDPASVSIPAGGSSTVSLSTRITAGAAQLVVMRLDEPRLPAGVSVGMDTWAFDSGSSTPLVIYTSEDTPAGTYPLTVFGDGSYRSRSTTVSVTVVAPSRFAIVTNPATVSMAAGTSRTVTVHTAMTGGTAEEITWSVVPGTMPAGLTATFDPPTMPSGTAGSLTVTAAATTVPGIYRLQVQGRTPSMDQVRFLTVTVTAPPAGFCTGYAGTVSGSLAARATVYQPSGGSFTALAGQHKVCLDGPTGADFDLSLQKRSSTGTWSTVASAATSAADEKLTYTGTAGTYRYRVTSYAGSGSYKLAFTKP